MEKSKEDKGMTPEQIRELFLKYGATNRIPYGYPDYPYRWQIPPFQPGTVRTVQLVNAGDH